MSAFRLETFSPAAPPVRRASPLERQIEAVRAKAYEAGFVAGQSQATDAHLEDQSRLTAEFVEALEDARMTNEAARRHVVASLAPVLGALARTIAPALAEAGLAAEVERLAARALAAAPEPRPRLRVAPEMAARVAAILSERGTDATVEPAPELLPREVQLFWDHGYDHLDLDACAAEALTRIAACIDPQRDEAPHEFSRAG
jgi:flagellar assembly protein FliH